MIYKEREKVERERDRQTDREGLEYLLGKETKGITEDVLDRQGILSKCYKKLPLTNLSP